MSIVAPHAIVWDLDGTIIGQTTSAAFGYRIGRPVALALIEAAHAFDGVEVEADIARRLFGGRVVTGPAFDPKGARMRVR